MDIRRTARLILLNSKDEILLMNIKSKDVADPNSPIEKPFWVTIGGKIENDETLMEAAEREAIEETGFKDVSISSPVWHGSVVLNWKGIDTELQETFVLARTESDKVIRDGLTSEEQEVVQKYKWWSIDELKTTDDVVIPKNLAEYLSDIVNGNIPHAPIEIDLTTPNDTVKKNNLVAPAPKNTP